MDSEINTEEDVLLGRLRNRLNDDKIKLWLPPFTTDTQERGERPSDLIKKYAGELVMEEEVLEEALEKLRIKAVANLAERNEFQMTGIATVKVKVTAGQQDAGKRLLSIRLRLDQSGKDLKDAVSAETKLESVRLKLIAHGKVVQDALPLLSQNVKHNSTVMAVVLTGTAEDLRQEEQELSDVRKTREAAELLSTRAENDDMDEFDVQIADQHGKALVLPKEERRALTLAMTLHSKGQAALKRQDYSKALLLLLEADKEFSCCCAEILSSVDNFAVLCLDIVWCYLCLENVSGLPDAASRLQRCEDLFRKTYGANNERLRQLTRGAEVERILLMRLHLLQGIVAFHQYNMASARQLLQQAMDEFNQLQVNPEAVTHLMQLGFSPEEARLGLRACQGNVSTAAAFIINKRGEDAEHEKKAKKERDDRRMAKKYGNCINGDRLLMDNVLSVESMGFPRGAAVEALKRSNNKVGMAVDLLRAQPELLNFPDKLEKGIKLPLRDGDIAQCVALGFEASAVKRALRKHRNNIQRAVEDLIKHNGHLPHTSHYDSSGSSTGSDSEADGDSKRKEENDLLETLVQDIMGQDKHAHLDLDMTHEQHFLHNYLARLNSL